MTPSELLYHVILTKPNEYANDYRARIMDVIPQHDKGVNGKFIFQYIG